MPKYSTRSMPFRFAILIFTLLNYVCVAIANPPVAPVPAPSLVAANVSSALEAEKRKVELLSEQNRVMREYHSSLLDTVYWALGGVFTTLVLLAGFGWWSNFKVYESDKQRLKDDLLNAQKVAESTMSLKSEEAKTELQKLVDGKLSLSEQRLTERVRDLRTELDRMESDYRSSTQKVNDALVTMQKQVTQGEKEMWATRTQSLRAEEHIWSLKGRPENALITQMQAALAATIAEDPKETEAALQRFISTLDQEFAAKGIEVGVAAASAIEKGFDMLPSVLSVVITEAKTKFTGLRAAPK